MGLRCGVAGLPNVGRSTLFDALTKTGTKTINFPFYTIGSNTGVVPMSDLRLDQLTEIVKPQRTLPTTMEFVDIAGLIKGVLKDEGLSNQLLTNIRETEATGHVVCYFENDSTIHVSDKVGPADDIEVINTKLALADLDTCERTIHRIQKKARGGDKDAKAELAVLEKCLSQLENTGMLRALDLSAEEKVTVRYLSFLTLEPTMYITNVNEDGFEDNPYLDQMREITTKEGFVAVPVCATVETDIVGMDDKKRGKFMQELRPEKPGLNRVACVGYKLLNLQTYFITGVKKVRARIIPVGAATSQAVGKIRTGFEKGPIRTQTISFGSLITYEGEQGAKETGKTYAEGKDYIIKDGGMMNFLLNT